MAHREDRSYMRAMQSIYRPKWFKQAKAIAWITILFITLFLAVMVRYCFGVV